MENVKPGFSFRSVFSIILAMIMLLGVFPAAISAHAASRPGQVKNLKATVISADSVTLTWSPVSGNGIHYIVFTYDAKTKKYNGIASTTRTTYTAAKLQRNMSYTFAVQAYTRSSSGKRYWGKLSSDLTVKTGEPIRLGKPTITAVKGGRGTITVEWSRVKNAEKYRVYRREKTEKSYIRLIDTASLQFVDKTVTPGKVYSYRVRAFSQSGGNVYGDNSDLKAGGTEYPANTVIQKLTSSEKTVKLTWSTVVGASGYQVYRSLTGEKGSFEKIAETTDTFCQDKTAKRNTTYYYSVRVFRKAGGRTYYSGFSNVKSGKLKTEIKTICPECGRILINPSSTNWNLIVVNAGREISKGYQPKLKEIVGSGKYLDSRVAPYYEKMYYAARKDGITLTPYSAYRSYDRQKRNYEKLTDKYMSQYGLSRKEAEKKAATVILPPGTSEHNLGIAVDICNTKSSFAQSREYAWLEKHAHEYGFILRYTAQKQSVTGIIPEPWHWRYVGAEYAKKIKDSGLCLEEYLDSVGISY